MCNIDRRKLNWKLLEPLSLLDTVMKKAASGGAMVARLISCPPPKALLYMLYVVCGMRGMWYALSYHMHYIICEIAGAMVARLISCPRQKHYKGIMHVVCNIICVI